MSHPPNHRGAAPKDERLFGPKASGVLRSALDDLCWLLDRGYAIRSASVLVGNRHCLTSRQRLAVGRCACTQAARQAREARRIGPELLRGQELWLDGFNVLTILETALAGGIILVGRDGCCRDVAGLHRRYRKVEETVPALELLGRMTIELGVACLRWWLDEPVSNSGRLKALLLDLAGQRGLAWEAERVSNPDRVLSRTDCVVATSDSVILDRCKQWFNLARLAISTSIPQAKMADFSTPIWKQAETRPAEPSPARFPVCIMLGQRNLIGVKEEIFDVVNERDEAVGQGRHSEVHRLGLRHRAAHILVFNHRGEIFLQKRSLLKDRHSGVWDSSAAGHVDHGESYEACAVREVEEELGWKMPEPPERLFKIAACEATGQEFLWVYRCRGEGPFVLPPEEIECGAWFEQKRVAQWVLEEPAEFAPAFPLIWKRYLHLGKPA